MIQCVARLINHYWRPCATVTLLLVLGTSASAQLLQNGDVVLGLNRFVTPIETIEVVRGPANGVGSMVPDFWVPDAAIQAIQFDNYGGIAHNARGNLLGVDYGNSTTFGRIYSYSTTDPSVVAGQFIGDTLGLGGSGIVPSRLANLAVSPGNSKIAVSGYDAGTVIVYDYTPGNTMGANAALSGARNTSFINVPSVTQGTTWLDDDTVLTFNVTGTLFEVDAASMTTASVATLPGFIDGTRVSALEYSPSISPYIYAGISQFASGVSTSLVHIIDPRVGYALVKTVNLSQSMDTLRDLALDPDGNLFLTQFNAGGTAPIVDVLLDVVTNPSAIPDHSSQNWYSTTISASYSGLDIALGGATPVVTADFNNDGLLDCFDVNGLTTEIAAGTNNPLFDLTSDGNVDGQDLDRWLSDAGNVNIGPGRSYRYGDANLDSVVDGSDFGTWNSSKFTSTSNWCSGDFNADGVVDGSDFGVWNSNKFTASDSTGQVPEPATIMLLSAVLAALALARRSASGHCAI